MKSATGKIKVGFLFFSSFLGMHFMMDEKGCAKRLGNVPLSCIFFAKLDDVPSKLGTQFWKFNSKKKP